MMELDRIVRKVVARSETELDVLRRRALDAPRVGEHPVEGAPLAHDVLFEAIEAREVVEAAIARLAALRRTDDDLGHLAAALGRMHDAGDDREAFNAGDFAFHLALSDAARNRVLAQTLAALHGRVREMIDLYSASAFRAGTVASLFDSHARLEAAVRRRDACEAPAIVAEMMGRLRQETRASLADDPNGSPTNGHGAVHTKGEAS